MSFFDFKFFVEQKLMHQFSVFRESGEDLGKSLMRRCPLLVQFMEDSGIDIVKRLADGRGHTLGQNIR